MSKPIVLACNTEILEIPLTKILPTRRHDEKLRVSVKYKCIEASIRELGLIEPLVVYPEKGRRDTDFILLDGHVRLRILQTMGLPTAKCLVATDDEGYTYTQDEDGMGPVLHAFRRDKRVGVVYCLGRSRGYPCSPVLSLRLGRVIRRGQNARPLPHDSENRRVERLLRAVLTDGVDAVFEKVIVLDVVIGVEVGIDELEWRPDQDAAARVEPADRPPAW